MEPPSTHDVEQWLSRDKAIVDDLVWTSPRPNETVEQAAKVITRGVTETEQTVLDGELLLLYNCRLPRHWTFKLSWRGTEVLRWDLHNPSQAVRHNNPRRYRPADAPRVVTSRVHEHLWDPQCEMSIARPLVDDGFGRFRPALDAFLERATLTLDGTLQDPPPVQEGLL